MLRVSLVLGLRMIVLVVKTALGCYFEVKWASAGGRTGL